MGAHLRKDILSLKYGKIIKFDFNLCRNHFRMIFSSVFPSAPKGLGKVLIMSESQALRLRIFTPFLVQ